MYDPSWAVLSAHLTGLELCDPVNGSVPLERLDEGVVYPPMTSREVVEGVFKAMKALTGTEKAKRRGPTPTVASIVNGFVNSQPTSSNDELKAIIKAIPTWWRLWESHGPIRVREDWTSPLSEAALVRMATSYLQTRSPPNHRRLIIQESAFQNIFLIFANVPHHRVQPEVGFGWSLPLPWSSEVADRLDQLEMKVEGRTWDDHKATCLAAFNPEPPAGVGKGKGKRGGKSKVQFSASNVAKANPNSIPNPFQLVTPISRDTSLLSYFASHLSNPSMWPASPTWPEIKVFITSWEKQELENIDRAFANQPSLIKDSLHYPLFETLMIGWQSLLVSCIEYST